MFFTNIKLAGNLKFAIFTTTEAKTTQPNIIDNLGLGYDTLYLVQKNPDVVFGGCFQTLENTPVLALVNSLTFLGDYTR